MTDLACQVGSNVGLQALGPRGSHVGRDIGEAVGEVGGKAIDSVYGTVKKKVFGKGYVPVSYHAARQQVRAVTAQPNQLVTIRSDEEMEEDDLDNAQDVEMEELPEPELFRCLPRTRPYLRSFLKSIRQEDDNGLRHHLRVAYDKAVDMNDFLIRTYNATHTDLNSYSQRDFMNIIGNVVWLPLVGRAYRADTRKCLGGKKAEGIGGERRQRKRDLP